MDTPEFSDVIAEILEARAEDLHTAFPGQIVTYDPALQVATIQPTVRRTDGSILPQLPNVPVLFPRGGGYFLSLPLIPGDFVLVVVCESSIDQWRAKGQITDPGDPRRHSPTAAVAYPGLYPTAGALADAHPADMVLGRDGGAQVHIGPTDIRLGSGSAADPVALAGLVYSAISALLAAGAAVTPPPTPGPATIAAMQTAWASLAVTFAGMGATKIKGE